MELTKAQKAAVEFDKNALLVSAAAGSGKTFVLAQRVIRKLCDINPPAYADKLMILTFTEAAANEMRERITTALRERLARSPHDPLIRRQLLLLQGAKISTIHSACLDIIRSNFHLLNIDPQFTIADDKKMILIKSNLTELFIESLYQRAIDDENYANLIEYFGSGEELARTIDRVSEFLEKQPYPEIYIKKSLSQPTDDVFSILPGDEFYNLLCEKFGGIIKKYDELIERVGFCQKLASFYSDEKTNIELIAKSVKKRDFDKAVSLAKELKFSNHIRRIEGIELWQTFADCRARLKNMTRQLVSDFLFEDSAAVIADRKTELLLISTLFNACKEFNDMLFDYRVRNRLMTYNDMEKYALSLLVTTEDGENFEKTDLAKELSQGIDEIIVDEYQDCNLTQNMLFYALSRDMKNIFMVGDVKQSIYRFRGARPELFVRRLTGSVPYLQDGSGEKATAIDLNCNFRSSVKILDFVNAVFDRVMTSEVCGIEYKNGHRLETHPLVNQDKFANVSVDVIVHYLKGGAPKRDTLPIEAQFVASKIKSIVENGELITDIKTGKERKIRYSDIAILMRAPKSDGVFFEKALEDASIECINNNANENYLDNMYVRSALAFLQAIDNPYEEIPLVTVMYSDFFGFTVTELGSIRAKNKRMPFFDAIKEYAKTDAKTADFVKTLDYLRTLSLTSDVYTVISAIYEKSGILLKLAEKDNADSIKANLSMLLDYAADFESVRYKGLFAFITYIAKLMERGDSIPAAKIKNGGDCVSILSIHKSKGLEYPLVFVVNSAAPADKSSSSSIALSDGLGAAANIIDNKLHRRFSTVTNNAMSEQERKYDVAESLRTLYVALTRAKNKLYITGSLNVKNIEQMIGEIEICKGNPSAVDITEKPSFLKWILLGLYGSEDYVKLSNFAGVPCLAAGCEKFADINLDIMMQDDIQNEGEGPLQTQRQTLDSQFVKEKLVREYKYKKSTLIPAKLSVSEIKNSSVKKKSFYKPGFLSDSVRGTDVGNATHGFLQFCDFSRIYDEQSFETEKERLVEYEFISERDALLVNGAAILEFLTSDKMKSLISCGNCKKEDRFIFTLPAREVTESDSDEPVVIQGIIDCWFETDSGAIIVDYKTDFVKDESELKERYAVQLDMYEKAINEIYSLSVTQKYIYSFCLRKFIRV